MSAGTVSAGPAGVRNLRAMFENKSNDSSTSPPSRGRSPNGSVSSQPSRQVSKVRTSFVSVERPGESTQSPQSAFRKTSDVSSMAEVREEAMMEGNGGVVHQAASRPQEINLGTILKGSPFEAQNSIPTELPQTSALTPPNDEPPRSPEKPKTNGAQGTNKVASMVGRMQSADQPALKTQSTTDTKSSRQAPSALNTKATISKSKDSPTSAKKSPVLQKKDSPITASNTGATIKPKGGVNKITGIIQSSNRAKEERAKAEDAECADVPAEEVPTSGTGPTIKPKGGVNKITGIIQSSNKAKEERAKAEQSEPTNGSGKKQPSVNGNGPGIKVKGGVNKITGIIQSSNRAKEERAKAEQVESAEDKKPTPKDAGPPSMASKSTAASKAHAQKQEKSSTAEQIKSPTTTRSTKLPSAATAGTAASTARKGANASEEETKATTSDRRSILPQAPRVANTPTRASLAKKSSRASLANGEDRPKSRVSAPHKPTDESFLARMTRPTASSARRAQETQVGSPPRARQVSANQEALKKPGRKSLSTSSKPVPHADDANETLLEPVSENMGTAMMETAEQDEGEPGPAEEEGEDITTHHQPQPAEVVH